jgi:serine phosphatase RsbU (regulator of sigma subunit)
MPIKKPTIKMPNKEAWLKRQSLSSLLLMMVLSGIILASTVIGSYGINTLYENKLRDTWAIMFLELEQRGNTLSRKIQTYPFAGNDAKKSGMTKTPNVLKFGSDNTLKSILGNMPSTMNLKELGLKSNSLNSPWNVLQIHGIEYLAKIVDAQNGSKLLKQKLGKGQYLFLWKLKIAQWLKNADNAPDETVTYTFTREGKLLYTNRSNITTANFANRPLVQNFIKNPIAQGQTEYKTSTDESMYGFFQEVPNTNVITMVETSKYVALGAIKKIITRSVIVLLIVLVLSALFIQWPLKYTIGPIRELVENSARIAKGEFGIKTKNAGFGELKVLADTFDDMSTNLLKRDEEIKLLMIEQQEKVRLEKEIAIASSIQNNLLPQESLPIESGIELAATYIPAEECAGDWYQHYFDKSENETIIAMSDVSGHGAGSSMFTAIIASVFEQTKQMTGPFNMGKFADSVCNSIFSIGKGGWHSTSIIIRHKHDKEELDLLFCGHPFPFVKYPDGSEFKSSFVNGRSNILGLTEKANPKAVTIPFPKGSCLFMYTDGLTEAENPKGKQFGVREIRKILEKQDSSPKQLISELENSWNKYRDGVKADDDICMISMRAS